MAANRGEADGISGGLRAALCVVKTAGRCKGWSWGLQLDSVRSGLLAVTQKGMVSGGVWKCLCTEQLAVEQRHTVHAWGWGSRGAMRGVGGGLAQTGKQGPGEACPGDVNMVGVELVPNRPTPGLACVGCRPGLKRSGLFVD